MFRTAFFAALTVTATASVHAAPDSGPAVGEKIDKLEVFDATGTHTGKSVDYSKDRGEKPTVYVFIVKDRWSRPIARFLRKLDETAGKVDGAYVVAVFLTDDDKATREYLPRAQQSIQLSNTALCSYADMNTGPGAWGINNQVAVTAVVAKGGKVIATLAEDSVNETSVKPLAAALVPPKE